MHKKTKEKIEIAEKKVTKTTTNKKENISSKQIHSKKDVQQTNLKSAPSKKGMKTTKKRKPEKTSKTAIKKAEILEYYDLPYRYHQTMVKVLAQTPTTLFVYWDIADEDYQKYKEQYGEYFFQNTKPVLMVYNKTKHYHFEVEINDFANSWYLPIHDSNCDYQIELGRRPVNNYVTLSNDYLSITSSNDIEAPNDHILFDRLSHFVYFKNVKTNQMAQKNITNLSLLNKIGKINSVQEFYQKLYLEEEIDFDKVSLRNPSSN